MAMKSQSPVWKKAFMACMICAFTTLTLGCPPRREVTVCNNSGESLLILGINKWAEWRNGGAIRIGADGNLDWSDLTWTINPRTKLRVRRLDVYWYGRMIAYPLALPPAGGKFLDRSTGLYREALQMESDQKIYAVYAGEKCPAAEIPLQPTGVPLEAVH